MNITLYATLLTRTFMQDHLYIASSIDYLPHAMCLESSVSTSCPYSINT